MKRAREADAEHILPAIAFVEKVAEVSISVLDNLGVGIGDSSTFSDAGTKDEKVQWLQAYANAVYHADISGIKAHVVLPPSIVDRAERLAARVFAIVRMLRCLVSPNVSSGGTAAPQSITVVSKTEEESSYSVEFPGSELETQQEMCVGYYCRPFHADFVPKVAVMRRMAYSVKVDHKLPSLVRIPLSALRASPHEPTFILFKRWCVGLCIISAGVSPPSSYDAGGYGKAGGTTLWLAWWDCLDLLDTLESQLVALSEAARTSVIESVVSIVSGATGQGSPRLTASCAIGRAVADAIRIVASAAAADANASRKRPVGEEEETPKMGPNGLARLKGGNPNGVPCRDFIKGRCPRPTCSFAHVKPAAAAVPPAGADE